MPARTPAVTALPRAPAPDDDAPDTGRAQSVLLLPAHASDGEALCDAVALPVPLRGRDEARDSEPEAAATLPDATGEGDSNGEGLKD